MEKIRPKATAEFSYGNDGRDSHYYIRYECPNCKTSFYVEDKSCKECGTLFDWSKKATIETIKRIKWENRK